VAAVDATGHRAGFADASSRPSPENIVIAQQEIRASSMRTEPPRPAGPPDARVHRVGVLVIARRA
jgi:hypothetical protein